MKNLIPLHLNRMSKLLVYVFLIQCFSMSFLSASSGTVQVKNIDEGMISMSQKEDTIERDFHLIQRDQGFNPVFTDKGTMGVSKVNLENEIKRVYEIQENPSGQAGLNFNKEDHNFLVSRKTESTEVKPVNVQMDEVVITGTITDEDGGALPGVTVLVEGTNIGTVTDVDGNYRLEVPEGGVLVFSFLGFESKRVPISNQTEINLIMAPEMSQLGEVVVVGYGSQDKVNLTGSITMVNTDELAEVSMPTITQGLMGRAPGVFIKNSSGQAGQAGVSFNIRGFGSPLIIVDGLPVTEEFFQQIDPNEIESFNVLKDAAAAAVYGARAGNGVVLVTTKRGVQAAPKFTYTANFAHQFIAVRPEFVSSWEYAAMENVARANLGEAPPWSIEQIDMFRSGADPENYPNTRWWDEVVRNYSPQAQHNINVRGGTERVKYFASLGYFTQDDMLKSDDSKHQRFSLRSNLDIKLTERLDMGVDISITNQEFFGPSHQMERTRTRGGIMGRIYRSRAYWPNTPHPDPSYLTGVGSGASINPYNMMFVDNVGFQEWNKLFGFAKLKFDYDLGHGFKAKAVIDLNRTYDRSKVFVKESPEYDYNQETGEYIFVRSLNPTTELSESMSILKNINQQYFLTWDKTIGDHDLSALAVYEQLADNFDFFTASRRDYDFDLPYLFAGPDLDRDNQGYATEGGRKGFINRINYIYKGKYMFEVNSRLDGSPKYPAETRWGFFPSASVGWRLSEESFISDNLGFVNNLKIRASHGTLGFDGAGNFQFLSTYSIRSRHIYDGNVLMPGIRPDALPNPNITWEKMTTSNVGLDFTFWNQLLEGSFDYFYRKRTNVLGQRIRSIPDIVGANLPRENYEEYDNRGWELVLQHRRNRGNISYSIGGNVSWNRERVLYVDQDDYATMEEFRRGNRVGEWTDRLWRLPTDGLFQSWEEIQNWPDIDGRGNATIRPGDIRFVDTNGDGRITNEDMIIGGRGEFPRFTYGINGSFSWKGFDFSMLWQGAGLYNINLRNSPDLTMPFYADNSPITWMAANAYIPENPWMPSNTVNATLPIFATDGYNRSHRSYAGNSQFWLVNGAYVRLKNVQLGYNLPKEFLAKYGIENCKVFLAGYNVLTFSQLDFLDPEADTNAARVFGDYHPPVGTYNLGLMLNF